jgi:hypothetical protein
MNNLNVVVALTTKDNDYQAEQSASAAEVASRLGVKIRIAYRITMPSINPNPPES